MGRSNGSFGPDGCPSNPRVSPHTRLRLVRLREWDRPLLPEAGQTGRRARVESRVGAACPHTPGDISATLKGGE